MSLSTPETEREKNKGVRGEHKPGLRCYNCWEEGHVKAKCPKPTIVFHKGWRQTIEGIGNGGC